VSGDTPAGAVDGFASTASAGPGSAPEPGPAWAVPAAGSTVRSVARSAAWPPAGR